MSGADNPRGQNFDVNRNLSSLRSFATILKKNLFEVFHTIFFHDFIHVYSCGAGADCNPLGTKFWCQQKCLVTSFICCKFQKNVHEVWFYTFFFFHDLMHVYSPGAGADSPQGTKFWCQQKGFITLPICCKFQRNLFEVRFYTIFSQFYTCIYIARGRGWQPLGDKILMSTGTSYLFGHLLKV